MSKTKTFETGVHQQHAFAPTGTSVAGHDASVEAKIKAEGRKDILGYTGSAKRAHKQVLSELKEMPKPNLTKEESSKDSKNKLKGVEKGEMVEVTRDGKQEIVQGKEPLKKKPKEKNVIVLSLQEPNSKDPILNPGKFAPKALSSKKQEIYAKQIQALSLKKSEENVEIRHRWDDLKKGLNNLESIMDLEEASKLEESKNPSEQDNSEPQQPEEQQPEEQQPEEQQPEEQEQQPEEQEQQPEEQEQQPEEQELEENQSNDESEQKIIQALKDEGYSEPEIAYIIHGHHSPAYDQSKEAKAHATYAMANVDAENAKQQGMADLDIKKQQMELELAHKKRMQDHEHDQAVAQSPDPEMEKQHKQRMMDLEYENARSSLPDSEHQKKMNDIQLQSAMSSLPDPEQQKKMTELELQDRQLDIEHKKQLLKLELEYKKKEQELKLKIMEENMKVQAKNKVEHSKLQHEQKMKNTKDSNKIAFKKENDLKQK